MTWTYSTLERQWVCRDCGYMRPGAMPEDDHVCHLAPEAPEPRHMAADDVDAIHARIEALRAERG